MARAKHRRAGRLAAVAAAAACCAASGGADEAETAWSALESASREHGSTSLEAARAMDSVVDSLIRAGRARDPLARDLALRAVRIKQRKGAVAEISASAANLLRLYDERGEYREVPALYERERKLWLSDSGPALPAFCGVLAKSARADLALEACDASVRTREREASADPEALAGAYALRASAHAAMLDYARALADQERACEILAAPVPPGSPRDRARCHLELGGVESAFGDLLAARSDYEQAIRILEEEAADDPLLAESLYASAGLLERLGDIGGARARFERAVEVQARADPGDVSMATYLIGLAERKSKNEELAADALARRALELREKALGPAVPATLDALEAVAGIEERAGSDWETRLLLERVAWTREVLKQPEPVRARSLLRLARLDAEQGHLAEALALQDRAVRSLVEELGAWSPEVAGARTEMARTLLRAGSFREAFRVAREAEDATREHLRIVARSLPEDAALRFAAAHEGALDVLLTVAAQRGGEAGRVAWDELARSRSIVGDARATTGEHAAAFERLARILVRDAATVDPARYRLALEHARDDVERALVEEERSARLGAVLAHLPKGTDLVSYARYEPVDAPGDPRYVAFVANGGSRDVRVIPLGPAGSIEARVEASLSAARASIWEPVAPWLASGSQIFVVADGSLSRIDFEALVHEQDHRVRCVRAESDLVLER
jgi:tetratricopeptide (TPR) repeat protein